MEGVQNGHKLAYVIFEQPHTTIPYLTTIFTRRNVPVRVTWTPKCRQVYRAERLQVQWYLQVGTEEELKYSGNMSHLRAKGLTTQDKCLTISIRKT